MRHLLTLKHAITTLTTRLVGVALFAALLCAAPFQTALAQTAPDLGTAGDFAVVFGGTGALTCTTTVINGDVACYSGGSVGACAITGVTHNGDSVGNAAYSDFLTAYGTVSGIACGTILNGTLAGQSLLPGVYCLDNSAKTGVLNLNGPPNGVWIFKTEASAFTATNFQVVFTDGSGACDNGARVFWWSSSGVTVTNTAEYFMGTILAGTSATMTGGNFNGQIFATVSVTLTTLATFNVCVPPVVCPTILLTPSTLPNASLGALYSQTLTASGGTGPYTYAVTSGTLPLGISLVGDTLSGTPTTVGISTFSITATDTATSCDTIVPYTLRVTAACPAIWLAPATIPNASVGVPYLQTITATGGMTPYTYMVTTGVLPTGLTLSSGGVLSGTPSAAGLFTFTVTATDTNGCTGFVNYSLRICPVLAISPATLPPGVIGTAYNQAITATGGTAPYTYAVTAGTLPTGITLSMSGILSGTPSAAGLFSFTVTATDTNGCQNPRAYSIRVCPVITLSPTTLPPPGAVGTAYSQTITASGGTGPYTYAVTAGALPTGLTLSMGGLLSGTLGGSGSFSFTITATDQVGCMGSASYSFSVAAYDLTFHDDFVLLQVRTQLCYNSVTGAYTFNLFSTDYLTAYTGTATYTVDALGRWTITGTGPDYLSSIYSPNQHTATAVFKPVPKLNGEISLMGSTGLLPVRPSNKRLIPSYQLSDDNTLDNPPCGSEGYPVSATPSSSLPVRR